jgi:hypothetical protein
LTADDNSSRVVAFPASWERGENVSSDEQLRSRFIFCARLEVTMPKRKAYDHIAQARKLRHRGEECRTLAQLMDTAANAATYLRMADAYDALAEQEEQLASDVVRFSLIR